MWTCRNCDLDVLFQAVQPEVDEDGCYFVCQGCGHRNGLVIERVESDESISLSQTVH